MMLIYMIRVLFVFFFGYTAIYLFQMGISLCISIYRLEKYKKNKTLNRKLFPTAFAKRIPVSVIIPAYNEAACITETIEAGKKSGVQFYSAAKERHDADVKKLKEEAEMRKHNSYARMGFLDDISKFKGSLSEEEAKAIANEVFGGKQ